jgi:endoglucanase
MTTIPLWRGFNVLDLFSTSVRWKEHFPMDDGVFQEDDFAMIQELGFNFARIPMSYMYCGKGPYARTPDPDRLGLIDRAVELGQRYGVHIMLAFHRAPGYCVTQASQFDTPEKGSLFTEDEDREDFVTWWRTLAERYADVAPQALSFDLVNEPIEIPLEAVERTFLPAIEAITAVNPERLIQVEGPYYMRKGPESIPVAREIATLPNVVNSVHLYSPIGLTHYHCPWAGEALQYAGTPPAWPYQAPPELLSELNPDGAGVWDREALRTLLKPYLDLAAEGYPVHVGEMGSYSGAPHDVYLAYFADVVGLLAEYGIGWAMWNFRGPFGILDNGRADAEYADFHGHKLDAKLLEVLKGNG